MKETHFIWKRITAQKWLCISEDDYAKYKQLIIHKIVFLNNSDYFQVIAGGKFSCLESELLVAQTQNFRNIIARVSCLQLEINYRVSILNLC